MVLLQPRLHLKVSQRQILTPGLVQMVSVLALNKLELRDMITAEMVENPVLEELEDAVPLLDDVDRKEENRDHAPIEESPVVAEEKKDPFEEIDFGSFFQDYLDPGYRSQGEMEDIERPSFENFLSKPGNLTDHLIWQLGSIPVRPEVREAAELVIGNLSEDGYLIASDEELLGVAPPSPPEADAAAVQNVVKEAAALGLTSPESVAELGPSAQDSGEAGSAEADLSHDPSEQSLWSLQESQHLEFADPGIATAVAPTPVEASAPPAPAPESVPAPTPAFRPGFNVSDLHEAIELVRQMDTARRGMPGPA